MKVFVRVRPPRPNENSRKDQIAVNVEELSSKVSVKCHLFLIYRVMIPKIGITQFLTELHVRVTLERSEFPTRENARDSVKTLLRMSTTSGQFFFSQTRAISGQTA